MRSLLPVALILLLGAALRVGMLARNVRFHPDEALYASFARRASVDGDWLLSTEPVDKPPLAFAITAISFILFGPSEFAARLPSVFADLLTLAAIYALARSLFPSVRRLKYATTFTLSPSPSLLAERGPGGEVNPRLATLTLLLLALSPLALAFSATAFVDPLLTLWLVLACLAASRDRWRGAGIAFALAVATKQSALIFAPLLLFVGWRSLLLIHRRRDVLRRVTRFMLPMIIMAVLLALWSAARAAPVDFWTLGAYNNTPGRLIRADEVIPRLGEWLGLLSTVVGFGPLLILAGWAAVKAVLTPCPPLYEVERGTGGEDVSTLLISAFLLALLLAYWLIAFNIYDRYLLPLGPLILLLLARSLSRLDRRVALLAVACVLPFTANILFGTPGSRPAIGGDDGSNAGILHLAAAIQTLPLGSTVYDFWLGWELRYYLGEEPTVTVYFVPSPQALARAVCSSPDPSYFAAPANMDQTVAAWFAPLRDLGASIQAISDGPQKLYEFSCPSTLF